MAQIMVTPAELRSSASTLREYNVNFKTQVQNLETTETSLGSKWEGEAKQAFHTAFMNDKNFLDKFATLIEQYCGTLEEIAAKYEQAEAKNLNTATTRTI